MYIYGKNEFYPNINNKKYNIIVGNNRSNIDFMINYFIDYNKKKNKIIGIDFEFKRISKTVRDVALIQLNLESDDNDAYIFILSPYKLNKREMNILKELLIEPETIKVIHGSESLDIPYLYDNFFNKNKEQIIKFSKNLYDTKYLCEFYHLVNRLKEKCSIYYILKELSVISKKQIKKLDLIEEKIGPIYLVVFDINNLNEDLIKYALYDVLYLPSLYNKFINLDKYNIYYKKIIPELSSTIFYHKRNIDNNYVKFEKIIKQYNNKKEYVELYNKYIKNKKNILLEINYFKRFIENIIKYYVYKSINKEIQYDVNKLFINSDLLNYLFYDGK